MSGPGFFTRGVDFELPHPPINPRVMLLVHMVVAKGLALLRASPPQGFSLQSADEDTITFHLHWVIVNRLFKNKEVGGFDSRNFVSVEREPKVTNYDGNHLHKMPDLVFRLAGRDYLPLLSTHDGLFVECKPVDEQHSSGKHYCDRGIQRFVNGDYGWAMQDGMMVAYARDGHTFAGRLLGALSTRHDALGIDTASASIPAVPAGTSVDPIHVSVHSRRFNWLDGRGSACPIRLFHSWHCCD